VLWLVNDSRAVMPTLRRDETCKESVPVPTLLASVVAVGPVATAEGDSNAST
jgi:hypothetical protein